MPTPIRPLLTVLFAALLTLTACSSGVKAPDPSGPSSPAPVDGTPAPSTQQEAKASAITWHITHTASGLRDPGGPLYLAPPYKFELDFSGPVDRVSVETALRSNLGKGQLKVLQWTNDQRLHLEIEPEGPGIQATVNPTGGKDQGGLPLQLSIEQFHLAAFAFTPAAATAIYRLDPATGQTTVMARYPQPFQTVSLSPDGKRALLRQPILYPGQSVGITGRAYTFDLADGRLEDLDLAGLWEGEWSRDGGLLAQGQCPGGQCVVWVRPGPAPGGLQGARQLLYKNQPGEFVASAHLSPDGKTAAVFAGKWDSPLNLHRFDLTASGKPLGTVAGAAGVTQGPSGLTWIPALWSPDGSALVFGEGGVRREESQSMRIWLIEKGSDKPRLIADQVTALGPWSPDGKLLYLAGAVYDTATWQVLWRAPSQGAAVWSPDGRTLAISGGGIYSFDGKLLVESGEWSAEGSRPLYSPDSSRVYLPGPDRVVDLKSGKTYPFFLSADAALGRYRPIGFTADGQLLISPMQ